MPAPLRRAVLWRAMSAAAGDKHVDFDHVAAALRLIQPGPPRAKSRGAVDAPGHRVQRIDNRLVLKTGRGWRSSRGPLNLFRYELSIPGEVRIPETGWVVSVEEASGAGAAASGAGSRNDGMAMVRRDLVWESLVVRNRRPGDRFRPVGLNGWKKLQDLFVDRKIARHERDRVPLVVDERGERDRIVWGAGFGMDEAFRVADAAQAVLLLRLRRT